MQPSNKSPLRSPTSGKRQAAYLLQNSHRTQSYLNPMLLDVKPVCNPDNLARGIELTLAVKSSQISMWPKPAAHQDKVRRIITGYNHRCILHKLSCDFPFSIIPPQTKSSLHIRKRGNQSPRGVKASIQLEGNPCFSPPGLGGPPPSTLSIPSSLLTLHPVLEKIHHIRDT
jgi:hypothetical protein